MKISAIIQARMGSTRLPGKVLMDIAGKPLLGHVIERTRASRLVNSIVLATTRNSADEALRKLADNYEITSYAGSGEDVLDRYYQAATQHKSEIIVRITADDPFKDPEVIDEVVQPLLEFPALDYVSNTLAPSYPEGLDVEAFRYSALEKAWNEARLMSEREHVTPYIWNNPERFQLKNVSLAQDMSALRWTLDYEQDLEFARAVYGRLYRGQVFRMLEILRLLKEHPELAAINHGIARNAGYALSVEKDLSVGK